MPKATPPRSWSTNIAIGISVVALGCAAGIAESSHNSNVRADRNACTLKLALNKIAIRTQEGPYGKTKEGIEAVVFYRDLSGQLQPNISKCKAALK